MKTGPVELRCLAITPDGGKIATARASPSLSRSTGKVLAQGDTPAFVRALQIAIDEPGNRLLWERTANYVSNLQTGDTESAHTISLRNQDHGLEAGIILPGRNLVVAAEEQRCRSWQSIQRKPRPLKVPMELPSLLSRSHPTAALSRLLLRMRRSG